MVHRRRKIGQRIAGRIMPPERIHTGGQSRQHQHRQNHHALPPVNPRKLEHEEIQRGAGAPAQIGRFGKFFSAPEFRLQLRDDLGHIQLQQTGIRPDKSFDVHRRGEHVEITLLQRPNMVRPDFGDVRHLMHRETLGLPAGAKLFGNRWHRRHLAPFPALGNPGNGSGWERLGISRERSARAVPNPGLHVRAAPEEWACL